jgi:hypothetical protein
VGQDEVLKVVVQQPQFLPWAGLWYKVVSADIYVLYCGVKFDQSDHQHRVTMNGSWLTLPIESGQRNVLIKDVKMAGLSHLQKLARTIRQSCMSKKFRYGDRLGGIVSILERYTSTRMVELNSALFLELRAVLGLNDVLIHHDFRDRSQEGLGKVEKLEACLQEWMGGLGPYIYLAGGGGLDYMGYDSLKGPVETRFQKMHEDVSPDSVLQLIATHDDPLSVIKGCAHWMTKQGGRREWNER